MFDEFERLSREREMTDTAILPWSGDVTEAWLASTLDYRAASDGRRRQLPAWIAAVHLYQHATHHRGQLTTLLKQAGKDPGITDLPYLPVSSAFSTRAQSLISSFLPCDFVCGAGISIRSTPSLNSAAADSVSVPSGNGIDR